MSDLLSIGASGVAAYRGALTVIGDNIANAETPGYARRQIVLKEAAVSSGANPLYRDQANFAGVDPVSIKRNWDDFKAADARLAGAAATRSETRVRWLATVETALDDGSAGVGQSLTGVFTSAEQLAANPDDRFARLAFLQSIDQAASAFRTGAEALGRLAGGVGTEAATTVDAVNADLQALARINVSLRRAGIGTSGHTQLTDERDRILDSLSDKLEIEVTPATDGTVAVTLARSGGLSLVDNRGIAPAQLSVAQAADGRLSLAVFVEGDNHPVVPAAGAMAGLIEVAGMVADRRAQLDSLAVQFAGEINTWSAAGVDQNGAAGTALLAFDPTRPAATLAPTQANRDPATVAAAGTDGTANGNVLDLASLRGTAGVEKGWGAMVAAQSQLFASTKSEATATTARRDGAYASRDGITGVDLDYEAAELLRYQQAYNGSAKIIQVAREILQTIMDVL